MKRFIVVLSGLLALPAFAEVAPVYYDDFVEYTDDFVEEVEPEETAEHSAPVQKNIVQRATANRSTSRAISNTRDNSATRTNTSTRAMAASVRDAQNKSRTTISRSSRTPTTTQSVKSSNTRVVARSGRTGQPVTARASATGAVMAIPRITENSANLNNLTDSGVSLYKPSRVGVTRRATVRSASADATTPAITENDISNTAANLEAIKELTEYCKAQYAACMDNYCNVLDDNQGRCSCSKNIKNYASTEAALEQATTDFQDTVQKIKYIGLTSEQIESLYLETEAETSMKSAKDNSSLKSTLDKIKDKILVDAASPNASSSYTGNISMDLSGLLDIDLNSGFDLNSFINMESTTGNSNVSNQRGEQLFKTATNRCRTSVLNSCSAQGIDPNIITNSYDLEIDKQCIAYERSLNEANNEMRNNVRNATTILQQARLMLAQNKNSYDLRGCVAAIDSCMQDDYVCGADYELCLDPTSKYLANGAIVKGGTPGVAGGQAINETPIADAASLESWTSQGMRDLYATWNYGGTGKDQLSAWGGGKTETLGDYIDEKLTTWKQDYDKTSTTPEDIARYLLQKIGYIDKNDKVHGMCASAMKQCQNYTYDSKKNYIPNNEVVRQYLASTLAKIKLQQDAILSDYAEDCRSDVSSCLSANEYDEQNTNTTASQTAINACRTNIVTCMSVSGQTPSDASKLTLRAIKDWVASMLIVCPTDYYLEDDGENANVKCKACGKTTNNIPLISDGGQSTMCYCPDGYTAGTETNAAGHPTVCTPNTTE